MQDVLLSLHAVRATYDPQRPFMPWLLAILRNRLVDGARRHGRTATHEVRVEDLDVTFRRPARIPIRRHPAMSRCCTVPFSRSRQISDRPSS